jgi:hypothetical protein
MNDHNEDGWDRAMSRVLFDDIKEWTDGSMISVRGNSKYEDPEVSENKASYLRESKSQ